MAYMAYGRRTQIEKGREELQKALRIFEQLAQEHPNVVEYVYDVGRCHIELGRNADRGKRPDAALAEYAKAIEIMQQAMHKGYLKARRMLLSTRIDRAAVLSEQGDHGQATEEVEAVLRQGDVGALGVYDAACAFSRASAAAEHDIKLTPTDRNRVKAGYAERAMELLRQAVAKGWRHPSLIVDDPDLEPLRGRKDFQKLLAELEASSGNK
jgi:tetratricopeptide (TPR) repeat protein